MTEAFAIKPCPFCGDDYDKGNMEMFAPQTGAKWKKITCRLCGASAPDTVWNKRVTVSEKGEQNADDLLRECATLIRHQQINCMVYEVGIPKPADILRRIDAHLARKEPK